MKHAGIHRLPDRPGLSTRERLALVAPAIDIAHEGWPDGNPAAALARFRVGYEDDRLVVAFEVEERQFRADEREDNGRVWEDSCVECFLQPGGDGGYYNLECNATGTLLLAHGNDRHGREHAPREVLATIAREARLEVTRRDGEALYRWSLLLVIPRAAFFRHRFAPRPGETARANFYKCGDKLPRPHFLAWNPVVADAPDFHRPECFGRLTFLP